MTDVICDLPRGDRPRERMLMHGAETLSDAEIIAILLGSGLPGKNAIQLARQLLSKGFGTLSRTEPQQMVALAGIGPAKATRVAAAFELARRISSAKPDDPPDYDTNIFGRALVTQCAKYRQERLGAAFLDSRHRIMLQKEIFVGTVDHALVSTKEVMRHAVMECASALVVYHNHPSGDPTPSREDTNFTQKLRETLGLVDVELVDHLVIGAHRFLSMKEARMF